MDGTRGGGLGAVVMFNLGYLPGDNHGFHDGNAGDPGGLARRGRSPATGRRPLRGLLPRPPGGGGESAEVEAWISARSSNGWRVAKYAMAGTLRPAPYLLLARKSG